MDYKPARALVSSNHTPTSTVGSHDSTTTTRRSRDPSLDDASADLAEADSTHLNLASWCAKQLSSQEPLRLLLYVYIHNTYTLCRVKRWHSMYREQ